MEEEAVAIMKDIRSSLLKETNAHIHWFSMYSKNFQVPILNWKLVQTEDLGTKSLDLI